MSEKKSVRLLGFSHSIDYLPTAFRMISRLREGSVLGLEANDSRSAQFDRIYNSSDPERELRLAVLKDAKISKSTPKMLTVPDEELLEHFLRNNPNRPFCEALIFFYRVYAFARKRGIRSACIVPKKVHEARVRGIQKINEAQARRENLLPVIKSVAKEIHFDVETAMAEGAVREGVTDIMVGAAHVEGITAELRNKKVPLRRPYIIKPKDLRHMEGMRWLLRELRPLRPHSQRRQRRPR